MWRITVHTVFSFKQVLIIHLLLLTEKHFRKEKRQVSRSQFFNIYWYFVNDFINDCFRVRGASCLSFQQI